jgi:hypothetical protein
MALPKIFKSLIDHVADYSSHGATSEASANRLMLRDTNGRVKVSAPSDNDDVALKQTIIDAISELIQHGNKQGSNEYWIKVGSLIINYGNLVFSENIGYVDIVFPCPFTKNYTITFGPQIGGTLEQPNGRQDVTLMGSLNSSKSLTGCRVFSFYPD